MSDHPVVDDTRARMDKALKRALNTPPAPKKGKAAKPNGRKPAVPADKKKVPLVGGGEVDATIMPFRAGVENWNEYLLDDGTVLRVKLVATEVLCIDGAYNEDGDPIYLVKSQNIVAASVPSKLRRKQGQQ